MGVGNVTAQSTRRMHYTMTCLNVGVRFVTAQSTRHMHYIMTCLSGDCVVLVTITVTTNLCTKETLCSPGVR